MLCGWIVDGIIINKTASEMHKDREEKLLTLEANEKFILIEGTYSGFENRTVVGQLKLTTSNGRTFGSVFYIIIFIFVWFNL